MRNDGKPLEKLIRLIYEALNDRQDVEILSNVKLDDLYGGKREIDVLIKSKVLAADVWMAIECKDYKRPVSIEKLDAFKTKCDSIPRINKKIFVSTSGYASGAKRNALSFGIALYQISELNADDVLSWFPVMNQLRLKLRVVDVRYGFGVPIDEDLRKSFFELALYRNGSLEVDNIHALIQEAISSNASQFWNDTLLAFMRNKEETLNEGIIQQCTIDFPTGYTLVNNNNKHIPLNQFLIFVNTSLIEYAPDIIEATSYVELEKGEITKQMTVNIGNNTKAEIVRTGEEKYEMFIRDDNGKLTQLSTLAIYDPTTDRFLPPEEWDTRH